MNLSLQAEKIHLGGFHQAGLDGEEKVMMRWGCCRNDRGGGNGVELAALFRMTLFWSYPGITLLINGKKRAFVCDTGACRTTAENRSQTDLYSWIQEEWVQLMLKEEMGLRTQMVTIGNDPFKICRKSSKWMRMWWNSDARISTPSWLDNKMMEKRHQREEEKDGLLWCRERGAPTIITLWTPLTSYHQGIVRALLFPLRSWWPAGFNHLEEAKSSCMQMMLCCPLQMRKHAKWTLWVCWNT